VGPGRNGHLTREKATGILEECAFICRGDSFKQSQKLVSECLKVSTGSGLQMVTVEDYFRDWMAAKEETGRNAQGTLDRYAPVLNRFLSYLPEVRRGAALSSITPLDCTGFLRAEKSKGTSAVSANQSIRILRIVFNSARRQGLINTNAAEAVELYPEDPHQRQAFTIDQVRSILQVADTEWTGMILCGLYTGLRIGDAANLIWSNLDLENNLLVFRPQKTARRTNKVTTVDIHRDLLDYFHSLQPAVPAAPLFPTLTWRPIGSANGLSARFQRLLTAAGIHQPIGTSNGSKRVWSPLSFHSLRHTFISQLSDAGVSIEVRRELAGHASDAVSLGYTHVSRSLTAAAINLIPSIGKAA
jgi:integrase